MSVQFLACALWEYLRICKVFGIFFFGYTNTPCGDIITCYDVYCSPKTHEGSGLFRSCGCRLKRIEKTDKLVVLDSQMSTLYPGVCSAEFRRLEQPHVPLDRI